MELFRVMDWLLQLPEGSEQEFKRELIAFEEQTNMPYITSDDTADVWSPEDFVLLEPLSTVTRWSQPDVFADVLADAA